MRILFVCTGNTCRSPMAAALMRRRLDRAGREDIIAVNEARLAVYTEFAPKFLSEQEIQAEIAAVLKELGIEKPAPQDKGRIMKLLMPRVKGKAEGAEVNRLVAALF